MIFLEIQGNILNSWRLSKDVAVAFEHLSFAVRDRGPAPSPSGRRRNLANFRVGVGRLGMGLSFFALVLFLDEPLSQSFPLLVTHGLAMPNGHCYELLGLV